MSRQKCVRPAAGGRVRRSLTKGSVHPSDSIKPKSLSEAEAHTAQEPPQGRPDPPVQLSKAQRTITRNVNRLNQLAFGVCSKLKEEVGNVSKRVVRVLIGLLLLGVTAVGINLLIQGCHQTAQAKVNWVEVYDGDGVKIVNKDVMILEVCKDGVPFDTIPPGESAHYTVRQETQ